MFNTLGNLARYPRAGLLFVDFETGDLLQLTGRARILWEPDTAVRVDVEEVRETPRGSALRFELVERRRSILDRPWVPPSRESPGGHTAESAASNG